MHAQVIGHDTTSLPQVTSTQQAQPQAATQQASTQQTEAVLQPLHTEVKKEQAATATTTTQATSEEKVCVCARACVCDHTPDQATEIVRKEKERAGMLGEQKAKGQSPGAGNMQIHVHTSASRTNTHHP